MTQQHPMFPPARAENAAATTADNVLKFKRRRPKATARERDIVGHFNEQREFAATLKWPEIPAPRDWNEQTDDELGELDFEGISEFRSKNGHLGSGPEFRAQLEAYFEVINVATRHAIASLGLSRREMADLAADCPEAAEMVVRLFKNGEDFAMQLIRLLRAAAVRQICGIALSEMEAEEGDEPSSQAAEA